MSPLFKKEKDIELSSGATAKAEVPIGALPVPGQSVDVPAPPGGNATESIDSGSLPAQLEQPATPEGADGGAELTTTQTPEKAPRGSSGTQKTVTPPTTSAAQPVVEKSAERKEIEEAMSEGLAEVYQAMTPAQQAIFRQRGEEVATKIEVMMKTFSATAKKVVELIRDWLKTIPGVNKYFLEQESKLKTDTILKLQRKKKKEHRDNSIGTD